MRALRIFRAIISPAQTLLRLILGVVLVRTLPFALHTDFVFDVVRTSKLNRFGGNCVLFLSERTAPRRVTVPFFAMILML